MYYLKPDPSEARREAYKLRSRQAIKRARWALWLAAAIAFYAIWQERALAPPVHDGMVFVVDFTSDLINGSEEARARVRNALDFSSDTGRSPKFNAITQWLLDNRN